MNKSMAMNIEELNFITPFIPSPLNTVTKHHQPRSNRDIKLFFHKFNF